MLLKAYEHFTNIYVELYPFESSDEIKGVIAQALDRKAFTCLKLALICKPDLYNLLASDFFKLALNYAGDVKAFNLFRANIYKGLSIHALNCNDLAAAEKNLTAGFQEIEKRDDMAAREIKKGLNECLNQYKIAFGIEGVQYKTKVSAEIIEHQINERAIHSLAI